MIDDNPCVEETNVTNGADYLHPEVLFLQRLDDLGVPLWVATIAEYGDAECSRPKDWQNLTHEENDDRLAGYHIEYAPYVCASTGVVAVFDCDTKNGCDPELVRALLIKLGVRIYAEVITPSGGRHFYVWGHPDLPSVHSTKENQRLIDYPGLDLQSHGCNVFAPATLRAKYGGTGYIVVFDELDQMPTTVPDEPTPLTDWVAEQLARGVKKKARKKSGSAREWEWDPCEPWTGGAPDRRQQAYIDKALANEADKVARTAEGGRNDALFEGAMKMGSYVAGAGLDEEKVIEALQAAAVANGYAASDGQHATNASIRSGLRYGKKNPRAVPEPKEQRESMDGNDSQAGQEQETPEEPPPYGSINGAALLEDLRTWFAQFVVVANQADLGLLALWVVHTFLNDELYTTPRLLIDSIAPGSGKTTLLEHLAHLCRNPLPAIEMSSAALIPRILEKEPRTILLDEIQRTLVEGKPGVDTVIAVINSGYRRGANRPVLVPKGREWVLRNLPTFASVAMAGNSPHLPQDTVDRSIRILLMPDTDGHAEDCDWEELDAVAKELQRQVSLWADSVRAHVKETPGKLPTRCVGRLREKWRPLKRVAELADGTSGHLWKDTVYAMAEEDLADAEAQRETGLRQQTPGLVMLQDLAAVWPPDKGFMATGELVKLLIAHNPGYWGARISFNGASRTELNATRFGRMVKQATNTTSTREGGGGTPRGYERNQFDRAWRSMRIKPPSSCVGA